MAVDPLPSWKRTLYARAGRRSDELALAAHALYEGPPPPEQATDFLDFFAIEWVDAHGWTEVEHAVREGALPEAALALSRGVRTAIWVVDGWEGPHVLLRDAATEDEVHVYAPGTEADLPRRTVLRARVVPVVTPGGTQLRFSGEPDVWEPMGVIARMELVRAWQEMPEPGLLARLAALRAGFLRQREERAAWIAHFGADEVVFANAADLERRLASFVSYLHNEHPFPSLGGRTRAAVHRAEKGDDPTIVQFTLGPSLTGPGRPGVIFDEVEGVHFLPAWGEVRAHLRGEAEYPDLVRAWLDDPGISALPFRRAAATAAQGERPSEAAAEASVSHRLARLLGRPANTPLDDLLAPHKPLGARVAPSVLPGPED